MCSCGNEDGCIGVGEGCRCVCHHHEIIEDRNWWKKEAGDILKRYEDGHRAFLDVRDERDKLLLQIGELERQNKDWARMYAESQAAWEKRLDVALQGKTEKRKCECIPGVHRPCHEHGFPPMRPIEGPGSVDE